MLLFSSPELIFFLKLFQPFWKQAWFWNRWVGMPLTTLLWLAWEMIRLVGWWIKSAAGFSTVSVNNAPYCAHSDKLYFYIWHVRGTWKITHWQSRRHKSCIFLTQIDEWERIYLVSPSQARQGKYIDPLPMDWLVHPINILYKPGTEKDSLHPLLG